MPTFLIVTGPPCSGKSTLARQLRTALGWPLLAKDDIKESLFDALGWSDRAWSKRLSEASYMLMFSVAAELAAAKRDCVLEGNFRWSENAERFAPLLAAPQARAIQIVCTAPADVLLTRWRARVAASQRHPGHVDAAVADDIAAELRVHRPAPLPLPGAPLTFDSSVDDMAKFVESVKRVAMNAL
jgi:predicted kinase